MKSVIALNWSRQPDIAIRQALERFELRLLGWRGFESLDWVRALHERFPGLAPLATSCSSIHGIGLDRLAALLANASKEEGQLVQTYFICKLALEELSCRASGAGAGACDKRAAYLAICKQMQSAES